MLSVSHDSFRLSFLQFRFLLFLFLVRLPWLEIPKLCWIIVESVLFLILEEMLSGFCHWEWCLLFIYHIWPLLCWSRFPISHFLESFYQKQVLNFVKNFFSIYSDDHIVCNLQLVNVVYHVICFVYIEEFLYPWIDPTGS